MPECTGKSPVRRVVVTGMGALTPLGNDVESFWCALVDGNTGIRPHFNPQIKFPVGWVDFDFHTAFSRLELNSLDRVSQMALLAAKEAVAMACLDPKTAMGPHTGVFIGTGMGGAESTESAYAKFFGAGAGADKRKLLTIPAAMVHAAGSNVALRFGVTGECQTYSTACSSSAVAIGEGFRRIRDGYLTRALVGGAECLLVPGVLDSWRSMRVLCESPPDAPGTGCRPFSNDRTGFALGEGAGVLVLELLETALARNTAPLCEIVGYGVSNDATHLTKPSPDGQAQAMRNALADATLPPSAIGYINAHGTATRVGDLAETRSIKAVFGSHAYDIPISATKSAHGHLMGATGAVEFIATALALHRQIAPATTHWKERDPECDLDYTPRNSRPLSGIEYALTNAFAFGGNNAALILRRWETPAELAL